MIRVVEYQCQQCGSYVDSHVHREDEIRENCPNCSLKTTFKRVWSAPHVGRGSNGEPPR